MLRIPGPAQDGDEKKAAEMAEGRPFQRRLSSPAPGPGPWGTPVQGSARTPGSEPSPGAWSGLLHRQLSVSYLVQVREGSGSWVQP